MEYYQCSCGKKFDDWNEYHEHLKQKIREQNIKIAREEAGIIPEYYDEVGYDA